MIAFVNKTALPLVLLAVPFDAATIDTEYQTPENGRLTLGDLSRLTYLKGRLVGGIHLNQATGTGAITLSLKEGANTVYSEQFDITSGTEFSYSVDVDISQISGSAPLSLHAKVDTAAAASTTAEIKGALIVEHPVVISG